MDAPLEASTTLLRCVCCQVIVSIAAAAGWYSVMTDLRVFSAFAAVVLAAAERCCLQRVTLA